MAENLQQILKIVLISSLVSANVVVWHCIWGEAFLLAVVILVLFVVLTAKTKNV